MFVILGDGPNSCLNRDIMATQCYIIMIGYNYFNNIDDWPFGPVIHPPKMVCKIVIDIILCCKFVKI